MIRKSISFLIALGKLARWMSQLLRLGNGTSWPGYLVLKIYPGFIAEILRRSDLTLIFVSGTNGKTTTVKMIQDILTSQGKKTLQNSSGANRETGIASTLIEHASLEGKLACQYAIFEVDEITLPRLIKNLNPDWVILLNLFRDQLDRCGEMDSIVKAWKKSLEQLSSSTRVILNADDPQVSYLGKSLAAPLYFGLSGQVSSSNEHAVDALFCVGCDNKLVFDELFLAHLGLWKCPECRAERPPLDYSLPLALPLVGVGHQYNAAAAALLTSRLEISNDHIRASLSNFKPAFGRQEKVHYRNRRFQIFLSKNPASLSESLKAMKELKGKILWIVVNRKPADGCDVSWLWDINFESIIHPDQIFISGEAAEDVGIRLRYAFPDSTLTIEKNIKKGLHCILEQAETGETIYILPNYTAMLAVRKIIVGRKIP